ncbi:ATP-binding protein [Amycolatopsis sp. 195334CR]|uniref:ATP-binding protein n=1 Tax=Amycolatopsis sp. 195334CR TaxID=2814588 RepID=UPI001A8E7D4C|nr:STAS domain-containing protein [Amycolatopsis sp. 195334CR]MBN6036861.1 ATP-binding protein [Amycolatopsis sp. 195334CR]
MTLRFEQTTLAGATVVTPAGRLELSTYRELRDHLTKAGTDCPRAVIVDLRGLDIVSATALAVFTTIHSRLDQWPGVPLLLADGNEHNKQLLTTNRTRRYVPVHDSVADALDAIEDPAPRRVDRVELANDLGSARLARGFMREVGTAWGVTGPLLNDAILLVSELVTNVVVHTRSPAEVRTELRRGLLSVSVSDEVPGTVAVRDPGLDLHGVGGLLLVAQTALAWGCMPTTGGGKVVWATLRVAEYGA